MSIFHLKFIHGQIRCSVAPCVLYMEPISTLLVGVANYLSQNMKPQKFMKSRWFADFRAIYILARKEDQPVAISQRENKFKYSPLAIFNPNFLLNYATYLQQSWERWSMVRSLFLGCRSIVTGFLHFCNFIDLFYSFTCILF